jgi:hypothetical protein
MIEIITAFISGALVATLLCMRWAWRAMDPRQ